MNAPSPAKSNDLISPRTGVSDAVAPGGGVPGGGVPGDGVPGDDVPGGAGRLPSAALADWVDRHRFWLWGLLLVVYLAGYGPHWAIQPDSATYLVLARSVYETGELHHPEGHEHSVQPGLAWLGAPLYATGGDPPIAWLNGVMLVMALACLGLFYAVMRHHVPRGLAMWLTVMFGLTRLVYEFGTLWLTDLPFLMGLLMVMLGWEWSRPSGGTVVAGGETAGADVAVGPAAGWWRWAGVALVVAGLGWGWLFRSVALVAAVAVVLAWWIDLARRGRWAVLVGSAAGVGVAGTGAWAMGWINAGTLADIELMGARLTGLTGETGHGPAASLWANVRELLCESASEAALAVDLGPWFSAAVAVLVLAAIVMAARRRTLWLTLAVVFIAQWLLFIVNVRYFLVLTPLMVAGWWWLAYWCEQRLPHRIGSKVSTALILLWMVPNVGRVVDVILDQRQPDYYEHYAHGQYASLMAIGPELAIPLPEDAIIFTQPHIDAVVTYFARWEARPFSQFPRRRSAHMYVLTPPDTALPPSFTTAMQRRKLVLGEAVASWSAQGQAQGQGKAVVWTLRPLVSTRRR